MTRPAKLVVVVLALLVAGCGSAEHGGAVPALQAGKLPASRSSHVVVIVLENKSTAT